MRWSKLKKEIYKFFVPKLNLDLQMDVFDVVTPHGNFKSPTFRIILNKEKLLVWPSSFLNEEREYIPAVKEHNNINRESFYFSDISFITSAIKKYMNISKENVQKCILPENDPFQISYILMAADKRLGKNSLLNLQLLNKIPVINSAVNAIIFERVSKNRKI